MIHNIGTPFPLCFLFLSVKWNWSELIIIIKLIWFNINYCNVNVFNG